MSLPYTDNITAINAVSATTTSSGYDVSKRQQITVEFIAAAITSGNGIFTIDATNGDPSVAANWITGIAFQDATATASTTWVTSKTLSSIGTAGAYVKAGWRYIRVKVTFATDGAYSAIIQNAG